MFFFIYSLGVYNTIRAFKNFSFVLIALSLSLFLKMSGTNVEENEINLQLNLYDSTLHVPFENSIRNDYLTLQLYSVLLNYLENFNTNDFINNTSRVNVIESDSTTFNGIHVRTIRFNNLEDQDENDENENQDTENEESRDKVSKSVKKRLYIPAHIEYVDFEARVNSFKCWPKHLKQKPKDLSDAGFYYEGSEDRVKCFFCDVGLNNWEDDDEPWSEHARWYPECEYVILTRGKKFVDRCVANAEKNIKQNEPPFYSNAITENVIKEEYNVPKDICKMCLTRNVQIYFDPCGHVCCCINCAMAFDKCPICRTVLTERKRVYF